MDDDGVVSTAPSAIMTGVPPETTTTDCIASVTQIRRRLLAPQLPLVARDISRRSNVINSSICQLIRQLRWRFGSLATVITPRGQVFAPGKASASTKYDARLHDPCAFAIAGTSDLYQVLLVGYLRRKMRTPHLSAVAR